MATKSRGAIQILCWRVPDGAAVLLATAQSLTSMRIHELGDLLSQAGEALLRKLLVQRLK